MEQKGYSFRDLESIVNTSKRYYAEDLLKDKNKVFCFEYLEKAVKTPNITDGQL